MPLSYAALAFPEITESGAWLDRGGKNIVLHLENDILDDGGYVERTPIYAEYMFSVFYRWRRRRRGIHRRLQVRDQRCDREILSSQKGL